MGRITIAFIVLFLAAGGWFVFGELQKGLIKFKQDAVTNAGKCNGSAPQGH